MSVWKNVSVGLLSLAMISGTAWGQASTFLVEAGQEDSAPPSGSTSLTMEAGETVTIEAWWEGSIGPQLMNSYQGAIPGAATPMGGATGTVTYVNNAAGSVRINTADPDWMFAGIAGPVTTTSENGLPAGFGFIAGVGIGMGSSKTVGYLGDFQVVASPDASGTFLLEWMELGSPPYGGTFFIDETGVGRVVTELRSLEITVGGGGCADTTPPQVVHADGLAGQTRPYSGYIDPRWDAMTASIPAPLDRVTMVFSEPVFDTDGGPLTAANFSVAQTGGGAPPTVNSIITADNTTVTVVLSRPITLQQWTTVIANVADANGCNQILSQGNLGALDEPDRVDIGFLPSDVDQNRTAQPLDLLRFRQFLSGNCPQCPHVTIGGTAEDFFDIDRSGVIQAIDLLRYRQLVFGTGGAVMPWNGATIGVRP